MKNINAYNDAVMLGKNWIATPFVLNYGFDVTGYQNDYYGYDEYLEDYTNYFGMEYDEYLSYIKKMAKPSTYGASFRCGDMGYAKYGAPNRQYNVIQLLFAHGKLKILGLWYQKDVIPNIDDYSIIAEVKFNRRQFVKKVKWPVLITCDNMLFKYTMNLFEDLLYMRFDKSFGKQYQYTGPVRMDSGIDEDTGCFESFSVIHGCMTLSDEVAMSCINKISKIEFEYEEEV